MKNKKIINLIAVFLFILVIISVIIYFLTRNDSKDKTNGTGSSEISNDLKRELKNSINQVFTTIAMTPDKSRLAILLESGFEVYDITSDYELRKITTGVDLENTFTSLRFNDLQISDDSEKILIAGNKEFQVFTFNGTEWQVDVINELDRRENGGLALSPNGLIYCANGKNSVSMEINCTVIGNASRFRNNILLENEAGELNSASNSFSKLALNKDNNRLAYTSLPTSEIYLFSPDPNDSNSWSTNILKIGGIGPREITFSPDGKYLGVLWNKYCSVYNVEEKNRSYEVFSKAYNSTLSNIDMSNEVIAFSTSDNLTVRNNFKNDKSINIDGFYETQMSADDSVLVLGETNQNKIEIYA